MPGDELVARPHFNATRAITVHAGPEHIWPWLLQMGLGRAGWYSYDTIDNLGRPSARRILPEYQEPQAGARVRVHGSGRDAADLALLNMMWEALQCVRNRKWRSACSTMPIRR